MASSKLASLMWRRSISSVKLMGVRALCAREGLSSGGEADSSPVVARTVEDEEESSKGMKGTSSSGSMSSDSLYVAGRGCGLGEDGHSEGRSAGASSVDRREVSPRWTLSALVTPELMKVG